MNNEKIGIFISELRKEHNMTQEDLAVKLHVDRGTISKWERGIYLPKPDLLLELSKLFCISVNEILLGERKTKENEQSLNSITVNVLNESRKKMKKILIFLCFIILLISFSFGTLFFGTYFVKNYNSISVHSVTGSNENFELYDTLLFTSKDQIYLLVGGVRNHSQEKIYSIQIYYVKDEEKKMITSKTGITRYWQDSEELYKDIDYLKQNLYIDITYGTNRKEAKVDTIKLEVQKEYSNSFSYQKPINPYSR